MSSGCEFVQPRLEGTHPPVWLTTTWFSCVHVDDPASCPSTRMCLAFKQPKGFDQQARGT